MDGNISLVGRFIILEVKGQKKTNRGGGVIGDLFFSSRFWSEVLDKFEKIETHR